MLDMADLLMPRISSFGRISRGKFDNLLNGDHKDLFIGKDNLVVF